MIARKTADVEAGSYLPVPIRNETCLRRMGYVSLYVMEERQVGVRKRKEHRQPDLASARVVNGCCAHSVANGTRRSNVLRSDYTSQYVREMETTLTVSIEIEDLPVHSY